MRGRSELTGLGVHGLAVGAEHVCDNALFGAGAVLEVGVAVRAVRLGPTVTLEVSDHCTFAVTGCWLPMVPPPGH